MIVKKIDNIVVSTDSTVKVTEMGNITKLEYMSKCNTKATVCKLSENEYVVVSTGEVKEYNSSNKQNSRLDNIKSVKRSLSELRDVLNTNIVDTEKCRWVTLTYKENMTDCKQLLRDFEAFMKRFRRYLKKKFNIDNVEYINAVEPQGRGAWHCHVVFIFSQIAPFIPNSELAVVWKNGFVSVKKLDNVDNVGAYLTAYLGDVEVDEALNNNLIAVPAELPQITSDNIVADGKAVKEVEFVSDDGKRIKKKYIKGARLKMYPTHCHIWRTSKGIKKPVISWRRNEQAMRLVKGQVLTFENTLEVSVDDFKTIINKRYYNSKRKKSQ